MKSDSTLSTQCLPIGSLSEPTKERQTKQRQLPFYLYISLAFLWLYSGVIPILFAPQHSLSMLAQLGIGDAYQTIVFYMAALLDIVFGILILSRYRYSALLWLAQFMVVVGYSAIVAIGLPENLTYPFAPLIKNIPIMALLLFLFQTHKKQKAIWLSHY